MSERRLKRSPAKGNIRRTAIKRAVKEVLALRQKRGASARNVLAVAMR